MFEGMFGRLVSGAIWGAGAGLVMSVARGGTGVRPVARAFLHAYVVASDKVREVTAEARESIEDLYHEAQSERRNGTARATTIGPARSGGTRRTSGAAPRPTAAPSSSRHAPSGGTRSRSVRASTDRVAVPAADAAPDAAASTGTPQRIAP